MPPPASPYFQLEPGSSSRFAATVAQGDGETGFALQVRLQDLAGNETPAGASACTAGSSTWSRSQRESTGSSRATPKRRIWSRIPRRMTAGSWYLPKRSSTASIQARLSPAAAQFHNDSGVSR